MKNGRVLFARSATDTIPRLIHIPLTITTIVLTADILCGVIKMSDLLFRHQDAVNAIHDEYDECCNIDMSGSSLADDIERVLDNVPCVDRKAVDVLLLKIYDLNGTKLNRHYIKQLYETIFGKGEKPAWMST